MSYWDTARGIPVLEELINRIANQIEQFIIFCHFVFMVFLQQTKTSAGLASGSYSRYSCSRGSHSTLDGSGIAFCRCFAKATAGYHKHTIDDKSKMMML
jgi:hypothetical protein